MTSCAVLVMTDGRRDCIAQTIDALDQHLTGPITRRIIHDDSGDLAYRGWLGDRFPGWTLVATHARSGFAGAYASAWYFVSTWGTEPWVLSVEDDMVLQRPVDLAAMVEVMETNPHLAQMALRRQAWNDAEKTAGGLVELHGDGFTDHTDEHGRAWLEHRMWWTTNACLHRRELCKMGWPEVPQSEGAWTHYLLRHGALGVEPERLRFGYWESRDMPPLVEHIGHQRAGTGY